MHESGCFSTASLQNFCLKFFDLQCDNTSCAEPGALAEHSFGRTLQEVFFMENESIYLETQPLGKLMKKYAVPCVISLLVGALYNIVDQIFIANAPELGSYGNAANTVVFPLTVIALALAVMVGDGCCTMVSMALGRKEGKEAGQNVGNAVILSIIIGIVLMVVYFRFDDALITMFGGRVNDQTFAFAEEYFFWISAGIPFYVFGQAMNPVIRADGNPRFAMFATLLGCIANIILDPLLIYGFHMGMTGAAVATVAGQVLTVIASVWYLRNMNAMKITKECFVLNRKMDNRMLALGITSFLSQIALVAAMAAVNSTIQKYSLLDPVFGQPGYTQIPMAVIGIVMKYFQVVISVAVGTAAGCAPIAAYNTGAGKNERVRKLFSLMLKTELIAGLIFLAIAELFPGQIMNLFGAANESEYYREFALKAFRIYLCLLPLATLNKGTFIYLQALGKAFLSSSLSLVREVVLGVTLPILLPKWFGLEGILFSMPAADIVTFAIAVWMIRTIYRQLDENTLSQETRETRTAE